MAKLGIGFNFTEQHFNVLMELIKDQHKKPSQIYSIYGSPGKFNPFGSVRESYREKSPESLDRVFEWFIQFKRNSIEINFALNSLVPLDKFGISGIDKYREQIIGFINYWDGHIDNWIIAHPGIIDMIHEELPTVNIIVSTIMNVHTLPQVQWIADNWPQVSRICPALEKNRDFMWLRAAQAILPLELLANEFCSMGGVECEGLYRQVCYMTQSMKLEGWKARDKCIKQRDKNPIAWLQSRFILPQWMPAYEAELGISHFKITGRTHGSEYLRQIATKYMNNRAEGNLLCLWGQLESTLEGSDQKKDQKKAEEGLYIPIGVLEDTIKYDRCRADICGRLCQTCKNIVEKYNDFKP